MKSTGEPGRQEVPGQPEGDPPGLTPKVDGKVTPEQATASIHKDDGALGSALVVPLAWRERLVRVPAGFPVTAVGVLCCGG